MDYNFFIKISSGILMPDKRIREHIDFCKRAAGQADFPQYEILCKYTLAGCYRNAGDVISTRETMFEILRILDSDRNIIYDRPGLQEVMEDMYVKACETIGQFADSYLEYETYMHKIEEIRSPLTDFDKGQLELVESLKNEGRDWTYNIIQLSQRYQESNSFADAAALFSLLLINRRQLRVSRDNINLAIHNYAGNIINLILECMAYCEQKKHPCNPYNYIFILEKAIGIIADFQNDMSAKKEAADAIEHLTSLKNELEEMQKKSAARFYDYTAPGYLSPKEIEEEIQKSESPKKLEPTTKMEQKAAIIRTIGNLILSGVCIYVGLNTDKTWVKIGLFILAFIWTLAAISIYATRKYKTKIT